MANNSYEDRDDASPRGGRGGRSSVYYSRPRFCAFCSDKTLKLDYKQVDLLRRYVNEAGKIRPRRQTGACAKHQRAIAGAVKQARHVALLPFDGDLDLD